MAAAHVQHLDLGIPDGIPLNDPLHENGGRELRFGILLFVNAHSKNDMRTANNPALFIGS